MVASVDPKLLEVLVCPLTKGPLEYDREAQELISQKARLATIIAPYWPRLIWRSADPKRRMKC